MQLNKIAGLVLIVLAVPIALALRAWRRDRARLGSVRRLFGWTALALTTAASALLVVFWLRMDVVNQRVGFPQNLNDWALTVARNGFLLATLAVPMNAVSIGRTRVLGLLAAVVAWLLYYGIFMSV
jgi:hypothetical protein